MTKQLDEVETQRIIKNVKDKKADYDGQAIDFVIEQTTGNNTKVSYLKLIGRSCDIQSFLTNFLESNKEIAIIPLHISVKKESESKNHFAGLYIKRDNEEKEESKVYYIDPTGLDTMPDYVRTSLLNVGIKEDNIIKTTNIIQHHSTVEEELIISNHHCGAFISSLLSELVSDSLRIEDTRLEHKENGDNFVDLRRDLNEEQSDHLGIKFRGRHTKLLGEKTNKRGRGEEDDDSPNKRQKTSNNTKLDNLARVLEGSSACTAVCYVDGEILVINNELAKSTKIDANLLLIRELIEYLQSKYNNKNIRSDEDSEEESKKRRKEIFQKICLQRIRGERGSISYKGREDLKRINIIANQSLRSHHEWKDRTPRIVADDLGLDIDKDLSLVRQATNCYSILGRTAHDFKRIEKEFNENKELSKAELNLIQDDEQQGVHAELRIINHLLKNNLEEKSKKREDVYIGISKLCCLQCKCVIVAVNETLEEIRKESGTSSSSSLINYGDASSRDTHGMIFEKNWICPRFMHKSIIGSTNAGGRKTRCASNIDEHSLEAKISKRYAELYAKSLKEERDLGHQSQYMTPSPSSERSSSEETKKSVKKDTCLPSNSDLSKAEAVYGEYNSPVTKTK